MFGLNVCLHFKEEERRKKTGHFLCTVFVLFVFCFCVFLALRPVKGLFTLSLLGSRQRGLSAWAGVPPC